MLKELYFKFKSRFMTEEVQSICDAVSFLLFLMMIVTALAPEKYNLPYRLVEHFKTMK